MKTKMTDSQKIERIVKRHEEDGWTFYARYSGRFMYGDHCPGIVCPSWDVSKATTALKRINRNVSTDSMGRDAIVYCSSLRADPEPDPVICPACGDKVVALIPSSGTCDSCTDSDYDLYSEA